jgi:cytochrome c biogenesis protein CcmG, thiol:disulfide interchange protein DsbE
MLSVLALRTRLVGTVVGLLAAGCGAAVTEGGGTAGDSAGLVGNPAPDFHVDTIGGGKPTVALKDLRGRVVLVDFWGTFCKPCKESFPRLQALHGKYAATGLTIIGISEDDAEDKDKIPSFAASYGAKFAIAWDGDRAVAQQYKPDSMPSSFVIDRKGVVRYEHVGFRAGDEVVIEKEIQELLAH